MSLGSLWFRQAFWSHDKGWRGRVRGGIAMMLKGANANVVTKELEARVERVQKMLPEGVRVEPYLNRSELVDRNISTVIRNLIEGALIVFIVLIIFLGNVRAGLIVASVIPLAMLFAFILMRVFGVSANLMSLGAIDFGIVVDGSIVILEGMLAHIYSRRLMGRTLSAEEMDREVEAGAGHVARSATFAVLIILIVFFPLLTLTGIEGKYFTPMAKTWYFVLSELDPFAHLRADDGLPVPKAYDLFEAYIRRSFFREIKRGLQAYASFLSASYLGNDRLFFRGSGCVPFLIHEVRGGVYPYAG